MICISKTNNRNFGAYLKNFYKSGASKRTWTHFYKLLTPSTESFAHQKLVGNLFFVSVWMLGGNAVTMALHDRRLRIHKNICSREYNEQAAADGKLRVRSTRVEVRRGAQVAACTLLLHTV